MWEFSSRWKHSIRSLRSLNRLEHSKIKFVSTCRHVISSIYYIDTNKIPGVFHLLKKKIFFIARCEDIFFLSFTCEDLGVAMVTNMISQLEESFPLRRAAVSFEISLTKCGNIISICEINRTLHGRLGYKFHLLFRFTHLWEIFSALEDQIPIPKRPCKILFFSFISIKIKHTRNYQQKQRNIKPLYCTFKIIIMFTSVTGEKYFQHSNSYYSAAM